MSSDILNRLIAGIGFKLSKYRGNRLVEAIEKAIDTFHRSINNVNFNMDHNGELRVLKILALEDPKCVFDVGANIGEWSQLASSLYPSSTIHAFEIVPSTYEELVQNVSELKNVITNNFGLSSEEAVITISIGGGSTVATGCKIEGMSFHDDYYKEQIQCDTKKAAGYLDEHNIETIDFLKIDVEGMDYKVIEGFGEQIKKARVVQFEYGIFNIGSHDLLSDFCNLFKNNGFVVGKVFPNSVQFFDYHFNMENFHGSNYLAVRKDETALIEKLASYKVN